MLSDWSSKIQFPAREPPTTTAAPTTPSTTSTTLLTYKVALPQPDSNQGNSCHNSLLSFLFQLLHAIYKQISVDLLIVLKVLNNGFSRITF